MQADDRAFGPDETRFHIEPVESFRLPLELPWRAIAFGLGLPCLITGILGSTAGWSDFLITLVIGCGLLVLIGGLRGGVRQERRRDALALAAYAALPLPMLARATTAATLTERTRTLIAAHLTRRHPNWADLLDAADPDWASIKNATGVPRACGIGCGCGPAIPAAGFPLGSAALAKPGDDAPAAPAGLPGADHGA